MTSPCKPDRRPAHIPPSSTYSPRFLLSSRRRPARRGTATGTSLCTTSSFTLSQSQSSLLCQPANCRRAHAHVRFAGCERDGAPGLIAATRLSAPPSLTGRQSHCNRIVLSDPAERPRRRSPLQQKFQLQNSADWSAHHPQHCVLHCRTRPRGHLCAFSQCPPYLGARTACASHSTQQSGKDAIAHYHHGQLSPASACTRLQTTGSPHQHWSHLVQPR